MTTAQVATQPRLSAVPLTVKPPVLVPCGVQGCRFVASAITEARALRGWAHHRVVKHRMGMEARREARHN